MATFLLEIGTEELPSRFLGNEASDLAAMLATALDEASLEYGKIETFATPRRLVAWVKSLADVQAEKVETVTGPAVRIAYSEDGEPTRALLGFAKANNVEPAEVFRINTEKGEYVAARKKTGGQSAKDILASICPDIILHLPFPKRMRWKDNEIAYGRPLHWIVALLDSEIVPFKVGPIETGRQTYGHRVHGQGPFVIADAASYAHVLEKDGAVILDPAKRKEIIISEGDRLGGEAGGKILWKDSLLEEVQGLVEFPVPLMGSFDPSFLEIPAEVLLTSMESHQKSFGVADATGTLLPHFLTVLNLRPADLDTVKRGWERVLRARLEDARFFWKEDQKFSFEDWLAKLEHVIFIGPLGTMGEKSRRLEKLCAWLAERTGAVDPSLAARAGLLAKADLVSGMVGEFDTLQGIMGGIYAEKAGENPEVAQAIRGQYLPTGPDSPLPQTLAGCILSVADKADTLAGCFGLDMIPTGVADPNGLRRCALGIIRIFLDRNITVSVSSLFIKARELYGQKKWKLNPAEATAMLMEFLEGRLRNYFIGKGYDTVLVNAVIAAGMDNLPACAKRLDAITAFAKGPQFEKSVQTIKRVSNIAKKADDSSLQSWQKELLSEEAEKQLSEILEKLLPELDTCLEAGEYERAFAILAELRLPVDNFFDKTMVMCEENALRRNRLGMLNAIGNRYGKIADFLALQV